MVPKIACYNVFSSSVLLVVSLGDAADAKRIAVVAHSRRHVRDVLKSFGIVDPGNRPLRALMGDMDRVGFPEQSAGAMILLGGSAPQAMHVLADFMDAHVKTGSSVTTPRMNVLPRCCVLRTSEDPAVQDGMVGYADAREAFHFWIFYSKQEGLRVLRSIGGSETERAYAEAQIAQCGLPLRGGDSVHLAGEIARYLCLAGELRKQTDLDAS